MRRHNAIIQCASGHASFAMWYTTLYTRICDVSTRISITWSQPKRMHS